MAEKGKVTPNQKCHRWSICVIYCPRCRGYRERHDHPRLILYYSLHSTECQVMNMCHFVCRSLSGPGRASMENGVLRINDIENDREEIENSCLPEPCRLKCTSELSWFVPSSFPSSSSILPPPYNLAGSCSSFKGPLTAFFLWFLTAKGKNEALLDGLLAPRPSPKGWKFLAYQYFKTSLSVTETPWWWISPIS